MRESTLALYEHQLRAFLRWLADRGLDLKSVGPPSVRDYLRDLRTAGYQNLSVLAVLKSLQRFASFAVEQRLVSENPTAGICHGCLELRATLPGRPSALRELTASPSVALKSQLPIYGPVWDRYLRHLLNLDYSRSHVLRTLSYNACFHRFLAKRGVRRLARVAREHFDAFLGSGPIISQRRGRPLLRVSKEAAFYIAPFLRYALPGKFSRRPPSPESRIVPKRLLDRYLHFCRSHQGHSSQTQKARALWIGKLGLFLDGQGLRDLRGLDVRHLDAFMREQAKTLTPRSLHAVASNLRSFLRYLFLRGTIHQDLARQVAMPVRFSAELRPKYLPSKKVDELLAAIDRGCTVGKRDYAMVLLMAHHGLRSHEVAALKVADIDFNDSAIALSARKSGPSQRLPLLARTTDALREYLSVRPASAHPEVFLRVRAPRHPLGASVNVIVRVRLLRHLGASVPAHGAHLLRHSFAKALLDRGAKLHDIGGLLGHRHLDSTLVYTRVATEDMREVADNYAQLISDYHGGTP